MAEQQTVDAAEPSGTTPGSTSGATSGATSGTPVAGRLHQLVPLLLLRAAHPRQAVGTALGVALAAALAGRPTREVGLVLLTVLVGQSILGWHNDLVDRARDRSHDTPGKPVADGRLEPGTVWFTIACAVLLLVPLSVSNGVTAGSAYLLCVAVGLLGNIVLRRGLLSWVPWAASYALYPAFLSYGGWGGEVTGAPPEIAVTVLAGLLGIGVHVMRAVWGLVADNADGWTYLPLRLGLKLGASRTLSVAGAYCLLVVVGLAWAGTTVGLAQ